MSSKLVLIPALTKAWDEPLSGKSKNNAESGNMTKVSSVRPSNAPKDAVLRNKPYSPNVKASVKPIQGN
jgi:hypothetical protein